MNQESLREVFLDQIKDLYDAEKQLVKALPKMAKAAKSEELIEAIQNHLQQTEQQVSRLEQIFESLGEKAKGKACAGMKGLVAEGSESMKEQDKGPMRDLAIIAAGQRVEHYEISAYGTARTLAQQLGEEQAAELLSETEEEEKQTDQKLTEVAMSLYEQNRMEDEEDDEEMEGMEDEEETVEATPARRRPSRQTAGAGSRPRSGTRR